MHLSLRMKLLCHATLGGLQRPNSVFHGLQRPDSGLELGLLPFQSGDPRLEGQSPLGDGDNLRFLGVDLPLHLGKAVMDVLLERPRHHDGLR